MYPADDQRRFLLLLTVLIIVATCLRFTGLTFNSYWFDELATLELTHPDHSFSFVFYESLEDRTTPLYQVLQWGFFRIFGYTEVVGRLISAIAGVGGVIAIYFLGRELYSKKTALYAVLFATLNYYLIYYSQEARSYSLLFFLATISTYYVVVFSRNPDKKNLLYYTVSSVLLVQTHYYGLLLYVAQVVFFLVIILDKKQLNRGNFLYLLTNILAVVISLVPAIPYILQNARAESFWLQQPEAWFILEYLYEYAGDEIILAFYLLLLVFSSWFHITGKCKYNKTGFFLSLIIITFIYVIPYIRGMVSVPMLHDRYTIVALPIIILLLAHAVELINSARNRRIVLMLFTILSFINLFLVNKYYTQEDKQSFRKVLTYISSRETNMPLVTCRMDKIDVYTEMLNINVNTRNFTSIDAILDNPVISGFWLVYHNNSACNPIFENREEIARNHQLRELEYFEDNKVFVHFYEK